LFACTGGYIVCGMQGGACRERFCWRDRPLHPPSCTSTRRFQSVCVHSIATHAPASRPLQILADLNTTDSKYVDAEGYVRYDQAYFVNVLISANEAKATKGRRTYRASTCAHPELCV
jgi:hypothetical protein